MKKIFIVVLLVLSFCSIAYADDFAELFILYYGQSGTSATTYWTSARTAYWTDARTALWSTPRNTEIP